MGAKQTKIDGSYIPNSPDTSNPSSQTGKRGASSMDDNLDPRSPNGCRTPINLPNRRIDTNAQLVPVEMPEVEYSTDNPLDALRKRFFKGFAYNINDPRSPSLHLNRTPLVFEDTLEKTLNLDDTFADLFVESQASEPLKENNLPDQEVSVDIEMPEDLMNEKLPEQDYPPTPVLLQQQFDPRSPSIGVDRTPLLFSDEDDNVNEDALLENILATLSLNLDASTSSSIVSVASDNTEAKSSAEPNDKPILGKPTNKHLDRVRIGKKAISKGPNRKPKRRLSRQQIYEDQENKMPSTPKLKMSQNDNSDSNKIKRTPLSCVRNRNVRSRSVESSAKSIKTHLPLTSFDDSLNPSENHKVLSLRIMQQGSQDSLEL